MKKLFVLMLLLSLLLSLLTLGISAAKDEQTADMLAYVGKIPYGTPSVDGVKDDAYGTEPTIGSYVYEDKADIYATVEKSTVDAYLLWDEYSMYGYVVIKDLTPVSYFHSSWKTDCLQVYFTLLDWEGHVGNDDTLISDPLDMGTAMFRIINPVSFEGANALTDAVMSSSSGFWLDVCENGTSEMVATKTDNGYIVEFKVSTPKEIVSSVNRAGHLIGFGFQYNDDAKNDNTRDTILFSSNGDKKEHGKTGAFILLDKDGNEPATEQDYMGEIKDDETTAPTESTTAPSESQVTTTPTPDQTTPEVTEKVTDAVTTAEKTPATTTTAASTEKSGGCGSAVALGLLVCLIPAGVVLSKKKG